MWLRIALCAYKDLIMQETNDETNIICSPATNVHHSFNSVKSHTQS